MNEFQIEIEYETKQDVFVVQPLPSGIKKNVNCAKNPSEILRHIFSLSKD